LEIVDRINSLNDQRSSKLLFCARRQERVSQISVPFAGAMKPPRGGCDREACLSVKWRDIRLGFFLEGSSSFDILLILPIIDSGGLIDLDLSIVINIYHRRKSIH